MDRRSLQLTAEQWERLQSFAADYNALAKAGPKTGEPSWRVLIRMVADRELVIMSREAIAEAVRVAAINHLMGTEAKEPTPRVVYKSPP